MKKRQFYNKKYFVIDIDAWNCQVGVAINMNGKETYNALKKEGAKEYLLEDAMQQLYNYDQEANPSNKGRFFSLKSGYLIIVKAEKNKFRETMATLVHELTHVSHYLLRDRRIPLIEDTEEAYTYLLEHLVRESLYEICG